MASAGQHHVANAVRDENEADDQKMLSNPERRRSVQADDVENVISAMNWVWGGLVALLVIAMPLVLILVSHLFDEADRTTYEPILWGIVFLPAFIVFVIQLAIANLMAPKIGFDMIQERSPTVSMREAMRSNLTNMALVSALFLTVVYAMLQIPALSGNSYSMLSQCTCLTPPAPGHTLYACPWLEPCLPGRGSTRARRVRCRVHLPPRNLMHADDDLDHDLGDLPAVHGAVCPAEPRTPVFRRRPLTDRAFETRL